MPIGKLPRKAAIEPPSMDSTIDSRMSSTDVPKMELLKVNYVHQCKEAMMHKSNEPPPTPRLNNPARFAGYRRQAPPQLMTRGAGGEGPVPRKTLPTLPPPTVESWQLLQPPVSNQRASLPRFVAQGTPTQASSDDCAQSCCCSHSACSCSDSESDSDATEASTVTPDCEKSHSWNYRNKCSTRDIRRDIARAGIKSRADRIAIIENSECDHRHSQPSAKPNTPPQQTKRPAPTTPPKKEPNTRVSVYGSPSPPASRLPLSSRIPKPLIYTEANAQLQRRVKQLFQQEVAHTTAPKWMFQKAGGEHQLQPEQKSPKTSQSPRLQQKVKLERVHIRKKRQPLLIINQLAANGPSEPANEERKSAEEGNGRSCGYKNCNYAHCPMSQHQENRLKRLSLESCSDSGVSTSNDSKEQRQQQQQEHVTKQTNIRNLEKCADCVKVLQGKEKPLSPLPPTKLKQFERATGATQPTKMHADPNDLQNFAKKNLTKATTDELLIAATTQQQAKQCNIENERKLNNLQRATTTTSNSTSTTTITIDDSWVRESCVDPNDDYMETDSLTLPAPPPPAESPSRRQARPISAHNNNSVKIFVRSGCGNENTRSSPNSLPRELSSAASCASTSSGCGGSSLDNSSLCDSEQDSCTCTSQVCPPSPNCLAPDCCSAIGGVFWNTAYNENNADVGAACCCSLSSCDEDDCSYYEGDFTVEHVGAPSSEALLLQRKREQQLLRNSSVEDILIRNNKLMRKTDGMHELRPRSMDGVVDSGVSLNGDASSSPDSGEHMQNQQDAEARRLKRGHVLTELLETERIYVSEMSSILKGYCDQMQSEELMHLVPASLQGKEEVLFGNLHELYTFHNEIFLKDLENCISTTELVALCFVQRRDTFYRLYSFYCQNIPRSERLRETLVDTHLFLQECQKRLGHKLPLAAYLLKPVQRITKYQLLLKDLLRFSDSGSCTKELQKALDCMLIVLKCVNDSMHQVAITGFPTDLAQQGELLLQDSFQVWTESKKDIRLRIKPQQRHIFLYQKSMLFCKQTSKPGHNKSTYQFKHHVKMSQIGLTESVRGDTKRFEVWLQGRQEVHTLQAPTLDIKNKWVAEIKRVLLTQLEELKGEKIKQYGLNHRGLKQTTSWDTPNIILGTPSRAISCDASSESSNRNSNCSSDDNVPTGTACGSSSTVGSGADKEQQEACGWSSDYSNSEDEISLIEDNSTPGSKFVALADYTAMGHSEVSMREGETIELLKVGCAGWWYVRVLDTNAEGWSPAAYLESINRKSSRSSSRNQERMNLK